MTPLEMAQRIARDDDTEQARSKDRGFAVATYDATGVKLVTVARALIEAEQRLAAAQAALLAIEKDAPRFAPDMESARASGNDGDMEDAACAAEHFRCAEIARGALSGGTAALDARIHAERLDMRAVILGLVVKHIETAGKTLFPLDADEPAKVFRAALDAALARAREEMREAAVKAAGTHGSIANRIAALPTNGGK